MTLPTRSEDSVEKVPQSSSDGYQQLPQRKYEEYAYILDFIPRGKSTTVRGREGVNITVYRGGASDLVRIIRRPKC